jgi:prepilin-type N-terminal cleavage/methylation domain-containing protein
MATSREEGFSFIEVMVALALALVVAAAALSLFTGLERTEAGDADRMILLTQSRVAVGRLERDLRLGTAQGCAFSVAGPLLEGQQNEVVLLTRSAEGGLTLVEWEVTGSSLMRRKGPCPVVRPPVITHNLYNDNKTMLENMRSDAAFHYFAYGAEVEAPVAPEHLPFIDEVRLSGRAAVPGASLTVKVVAGCRVGR